jgi:hypothetical protein
MNPLKDILNKENEKRKRGDCKNHQLGEGSSSKIHNKDYLMETSLKKL